MSECDGKLDAAERRIDELTSELGIAARRIARAEGELDRALTDLDLAMKALERGRALFADLYKRHFVDMDDFDRQLADMCDWALIKREG